MEEEKEKQRPSPKKPTEKHFCVVDGEVKPRTPRETLALDKKRLKEVGRSFAADVKSSSDGSGDDSKSSDESGDNRNDPPKKSPTSRESSSEESSEKSHKESSSEAESVAESVDTGDDPDYTDGVSVDLVSLMLAFSLLNSSFLFCKLYLDRTS